MKEGRRESPKSTGNTAYMASNIHTERNVKTDGISEVEKRKNEEECNERMC